MSEGRPDLPSLTLGARPGTVILLTALLLSGCKSKDGGGASAGGSPRASDPLVVGPGRIPKQNIPIPNRGTGTAGAGTSADPLLGSPTGRPGNRTGYADDPNRWKGGPYVPGPGGTPAALASRPADDGEGLRIDVVPAGGAAARDPAPDATDGPFAELAGFGVKRGDVTVSRDGGQVVVTVKVPIRGGDGRSRGYTGAGPTEAAAIRQVVEQIKADGR
ncbi:MAG: hypothetical protein K2X87_26275 [Gemmataceae bacterium]|nr:hypothetical protein [Gemmataceae bacterium]